MKLLLTEISSDLAELGGGTGLAALMKRYWADPSFATVCRWRLSIQRRRHGKFGRLISKILWKRNIRKSGCFLSPAATVGTGVVLPHATAIVVGEGAVIGRRVTIYQGVTLGLKSPDSSGYPLIEDGARIFAGASVLGPVTLGHGAVVAANAVVTRNVAPGTTVGGMPARPLRSTRRDGDAEGGSA